LEKGFVDLCVRDSEIKDYRQTDVVDLSF